MKKTFFCLFQNFLQSRDREKERKEGRHSDTTRKNSCLYQEKDRHFANYRSGTLFYCHHRRNKCPERSKNHIRKKDEKERKKTIKSGLKTRLERFKNQKFSYPGEGDTPSPGPHPPRPGPTGLGAYTRPFGPCWCPPLENFPLRHWLVLKLTPQC